MTHFQKMLRSQIKADHHAFGIIPPRRSEETRALQMHVHEGITKRLKREYENHNSKMSKFPKGNL